MERQEGPRETYAHQQAMGEKKGKERSILNITQHREIFINFFPHHIRSDRWSTVMHTISCPPPPSGALGKVLVIQRSCEDLK